MKVGPRGEIGHVSNLAILVWSLHAILGLTSSYKSCSSCIMG